MTPTGALAAEGPQITFLVHKGKEYTVQKYLRGWGAGLAVRVRARNYPKLRSTARTPWKRLTHAVRNWRLGTLDGPAGPAGTPQTYVFTDVDRLSPSEVETAAALKRRLAEHADTHRILNGPRRPMRRFELLRTLQERGINDFGVYRAADRPEPRRWPVFVRSESDHGGMSPLLHTQAALDRELAKPAGRDDDRVVIEFLDTADEDGVIRKYGAFRVGDRILARQIHFSRQWVVRFPDIRTPETAREELDYVRDNPRAEELMKIFEIARIDYGRVDYGLVDGRVQVWEINTNPMILIPRDRDDPLRFPAHDAFGQAFNAALEALAATGADRLRSP